MTKTAKGIQPLAVLISMSSIGLIIDDICSVPEKIINDFQIEIAKTKLYFSELGKFPEKNMYQVMVETKAHPKTSAPSPGDYLRAYKLRERVEKELKSGVAFTSLVPPIVGANSGPGTLITGSLSL